MDSLTKQDIKFNTRIASRLTEQRMLYGADVKDIPSLTAYLINFAGGREATPPSNWGDNLGMYSSDAVKNRARALVAKFTSTPRLQDYEYSRIEQKYGPQGWIYPLGSDEMIEKVNAYYNACNNPCKVSVETIKSFKQWLSEADLEPYTYQQVIDRAFEKTGLVSNSGLPLFRKRKDVITKTLTMVPDYISAMDLGGSDDIIQPASVIGARSIKNKMRLIFMAPFAQNLVELSYVYPIMDWLLDNCNAVDGWRGQPAVEYAMQSQFKSNVTHLSTDFTAMDTSVGPEQVAMFRDVFQVMFKPQFRQTFRNALSMISAEPIVIGAVKKPGVANISRNSMSLVYLEGVHGLLSGLGWTNLVETGLSLLLDHEFRQKYSVLDTQVNGDDGEKTIDGRKNLDTVAEDFASMARRMGFTCNPSKQLVSYDEIRYLQRIYSPETVEGSIVRGAYPIALTLNSIKNPERSANLSEWQQAERVLNISNNIMGHPYRDLCIQEIVSGSPAIQQWLETGAGMQEMSEAFQKSMSTGSLEGSNFSSEDKFSDVEIVQYLQKNASRVLASLRR